MDYYLQIEKAICFKRDLYAEGSAYSGGKRADFLESKIRFYIKESLIDLYKHDKTPVATINHWANSEL